LIFRRTFVRHQIFIYWDKYEQDLSCKSSENDGCAELFHTVYKHLHKLALAVHDPLVTKYITDLREQLLRITGSDYRSYGFVVDATAQKWGASARMQYMRRSL
jgi:hypothetical protein